MGPFSDAIWESNDSTSGVCPRRQVEDEGRNARMEKRAVEPSDDPVPLSDRPRPASQSNSLQETMHVGTR